MTMLESLVRVKYSGFRRNITCLFTVYCNFLTRQAGLGLLRAVFYLSITP
jgi:hypothetical protein